MLEFNPSVICTCMEINSNSVFQGKSPVGTPESKVCCKDVCAFYVQSFASCVRSSMGQSCFASPWLVPKETFK